MSCICGLEWTDGSRDDDGKFPADGQSNQQVGENASCHLGCLWAKFTKF